MSKSPKWLGLYSDEKAFFLCFAALVSILFIYLLRRVIIPQTLITAWQKIADKYLYAFVLLSAACFAINLTAGVSVGEDLGNQVKSSLQWIEGSVSSPNQFLSPDKSDLSKDSVTWSLRPPGAALLPIPGLLAGFSLGHSIQLAIFCALIAGGFGWLFFFKRFVKSNEVLFMVSLLLSSMTTVNASMYSTTNIILYALVPWFILWAIKLNAKINKENFPNKHMLWALLFFFLLGSFAWIKLSGLITAITLGTGLLLMFVYSITPPKKTPFLLLAISGCICLTVPYVTLETLNTKWSGGSATNSYTKASSDLEAPLTGEHWIHSTRSGWLLWSIAAAPGYSLPPKSLAIGVRDFGRQFTNLWKWMGEKQINAQVFLAGAFATFLTILLFYEIYSIYPKIEKALRFFLISYLILPFLGLAVLSYLFKWNYLLYHAHTFEFCYIFLTPTLLVFSNLHKLTLRTHILFGLIIAFPITKNGEIFIKNLYIKTDEFISTTELAQNFRACRFSEAIEIIEQDSHSPLDILLFLPYGDSSDLILRTKMRTMATHFSKDNFPRIDEMKTSRSLNVYCAYDAELSYDKLFAEALVSKFPQQIESVVILSGDIVVKKLKLSPTVNG